VVGDQAGGNEEKVRYGEHHNPSSEFFDLPPVCSSSRRNPTPTTVLGVVLSWRAIKSSRFMVLSSLSYPATKVT